MINRQTECKSSVETDAEQLNPGEDSDDGFLRWSHDIRGWTVLYDPSKSYFGRLARLMMKDDRLGSLIPKRRDFASKFKTNVEQFLYNSLVSVAEEERLMGRVWVAIGLYDLFMQTNRYKRLHMSHRHISKILSFFREHDWIEFDLGSNVSGKMTRFRPVGDFRRLLVEYLADVPGNVRFELPREPLILKDEQKKPVDYEDCDVSLALRHDLEDFNERISRREVSLFLPCATGSGGGRKCIPTIKLDVSTSHPLRHVQPVHEADGTRYTFTDWLLHHRRVFNNRSWYQGGRFYAAYQNLSELERTFIQIDGEPTVELDASAIHPTILYNKEGLDLPHGDPYEIALDVPRKTTKIAWNVMLNAENESELVGALVQKQMAGDLVTNGWGLDEIIASLVEKHKPIQSFFCTGYGIKLQREDSRLANAVLKRIDALCVHDSFIVKRSQKEELERIVKDEYRRLFNGEINLK